MRILIALMAFFLASGPALAAKTLLLFGDSLSAGHGLHPDDAWPTLLQARLNAKAPGYQLVNLSISGETTAGGRTRLPEALRRHRPDLVLLELGANDGLRGLPLKQIQENLIAMIDASQKAGARVLLIGMRLPPNYGPYAERFNASFGEIAKSKKVALADFLFEGFADKPDYFQADTVHPNAKAQPRLLDNVWPALAPLLK